MNFRMYLNKKPEIFSHLFGCLGCRQEKGLRRYIQKGTHLGMFVDSMRFRSWNASLGHFFV